MEPWLQEELLALLLEAASKGGPDGEQTPSEGAVCAGGKEGAQNIMEQTLLF